MKIEKEVSIFIKDVFKFDSENVFIGVMPNWKEELMDISLIDDVNKLKYLNEIIFVISKIQLTTPNIINGLISRGFSDEKILNKIKEISFVSKYIENEILEIKSIQFDKQEIKKLINENIFFNPDTAFTFLKIEKELIRQKYFKNNTWNKDKIELGVFMERIIKLKIINNTISNSKQIFRNKVKYFFTNRYNVTLGQQFQENITAANFSKFPFIWVYDLIAKK